MARLVLYRDGTILREPDCKPMAPSHLVQDVQPNNELGMILLRAKRENKSQKELYDL